MLPGGLGRHAGTEGGGGGRRWRRNEFENKISAWEGSRWTVWQVKSRRLYNECIQSFCSATLSAKINLSDA